MCALQPPRVHPASKETRGLIRGAKNSPTLHRLRHECQELHNEVDSLNATVAALTSQNQALLGDLHQCMEECREEVTRGDMNLGIVYSFRPQLVRGSAPPGPVGACFRCVFG